MVMASFYVMSVRTLRLDFKFSSIIWSIFCAFILVNHSAYIMFTRFHYVYNMAANIIVGKYFWSLLHLVRRHQPSRTFGRSDNVSLADHFLYLVPQSIDLI